MKRYKYLAILFLLCLSLLTACGNSDNHVADDNEGTSSTGNIVASLPTSEADVTQSSNTASYLEPQYDTQNNILTLTDLATNATQASYQFDGASVAFVDRKRYRMA